MEVNTAILCACVPTLKGLVQRFFPKLLGSIRSQPNSAGTAATGSTRDSVLKKDVELKVVETSSSPTGHIGKRTSAFDSRKGSQKMSSYHSRNRSNASSEEAIVEYVSMQGPTYYVSEKQDIHVHTSVDQSTGPRHPSDPEPPRKYQPVRGVHRAHVSGAGRDFLPNEGEPYSPKLWVDDDAEIRNALGLPGSRY